MELSNFRNQIVIRVSVHMITSGVHLVDVFQNLGYAMVIQTVQIAEMNLILVNKLIFILVNQLTLNAPITNASLEGGIVISIMTVVIIQMRLGAHLVIVQNLNFDVVMEGVSVVVRNVMENLIVMIKAMNLTVLHSASLANSSVIIQNIAYFCKYCLFKQYYISIMVLYVLS